MAPGSPEERVFSLRRSPCPPGEFERLAQKLRQRRQRRVFLRSAAAVALVATAGGGLSWWLGSGSPRDRAFGGLTCAEVQALAQVYGQGEVSARVREQMQQHLAQCPQCAAQFKAMGLTI